MKTLFDEPDSEDSHGVDGQTYAEYLRSAQWRKKRGYALARAKHKCERCGRSEWTVKLEVHHKTYERLGHELPDDLIVLCSPCHKLGDSERAFEATRQRTVDRFYRRQSQGKYARFALKPAPPIDPDADEKPAPVIPS